MTLRNAHRIAYLCSDPELELGGNGQAARTFCGLARGLRASGVEVAPFITCGSGAPERSLPGVRVVPPGRHEKADRVTALLDNAQALVAAMAAAGPFDAVVEQLSFCGTAGRDFARAAALPLVVRVHERLWEGGDPRADTGSSRVAGALSVDVLRDADLVSAPHEGLARVLVRLGVQRTKIVVQPGAVDLDIFESAIAAPAPVRVDGGPSVLLPLERDQPTAVALCVEAVEKLRERRRVSLRIATSGPEASRLAREHARRRPELIHCEPMPVGRTLASLFLGADAVISHSAPVPGVRGDDLALFGAIAARTSLVVGKSDETTSWTSGIPGVRFFRPCEAEDLALALEQSLDRDGPAWPATAEHVRRRSSFRERAAELLAAMEQRTHSAEAPAPSRAT
jgi:hypothetical protein